jgi:hypothetical protein
MNHRLNPLNLNKLLNNRQVMDRPAGRAPPMSETERESGARNWAPTARRYPRSPLLDSNAMQQLASNVRCLLASIDCLAVSELSEKEKNFSQ